MALLTTVFWSFVLFLVASVAGFTSFRVREQYQTAMIYLNAASTGVILAAAFTHLLPDAIEDLSEWSYPIGEAMALAGFLLMVLVEMALHSSNLETEHMISAEQHESHNCAEHDNAFGAEPVHSFLLQIPSSCFVKVKDKTESSKSQNCSTLERQCSENARRRNSFKEQESNLNLNEFHQETSRLLQEREEEPLLSDILDAARKSSLPDKIKVVKQGDIKLKGQPTIELRHGVHHDNSNSTSASATFSLWLALVVHSLMEGFGVGVSTSSVEQLTLVLAIIVHKGFASLALASALLESGMNRKSFLIFFLAFACAAPFGAVTASLVQLNNNPTLSGIVTGLASGSFMYIGFMEMLPAMLTSCKHMADAMALFVLSAVSMAALAAFV